MPSEARRALESLWPGPRPYTEDRAESFCGRDAEIGSVLDRVSGQRLSVLLAPSAAGKTSLLQAGVIPEIRYMRLAAIESGAGPDESALARYPLLLNQWLGRAGTQKTVDFAKLLLVEAHRYLRSSATWYAREHGEASRLPHAEGSSTLAAIDGELQRIRAAGGALETLAVRRGVARLDEAGTLEPVLTISAQPVEDREITDLLLEVQEALCASLGPVLLILDQFEEVLGDAVLGRQAIIAVESLFKLCPDSVRQLISMRNDSTHLLEPLETRGTLERKRLLTLYPFTPEQVASVIRQVSALGGIGWDADALDAIVRAFTDAPEGGKGRRDVNLLGLQIVLRSLFEKLEAVGVTTAGLEQLHELCADLAGEALGDEARREWMQPHYIVDKDGSRERVRARIAEEAPRRWIERCLEGDVGDSDAGATPPGLHEADYEPQLLKPMVARMAASLVTPAGFKRPMTGEELRVVAYEEHLDRLRATDLAGRAQRESWDGERLRSALETTFQVALFRLVELGHVLKGRGSERKAKYELVHDQFGRPLQLWAEAFRSTPEAHLGSLYAVDNVEFKWGRREGVGERTRLSESSYVTDAIVPGQAAGPRMLANAKWRGCQVEGADFSGLTLDSCDLSRTAFIDCLFDSTTTLRGCVLDGTLITNCEILGAQFHECSFDGSLMTGQHGRANDALFAGGSMRFAELRDTELSDCTFRGAPGARLPMRNLQLTDCRLAGTTRFEFCSLDGATVGADSAPITPGDIVISDCDLKGAEFNSLHFGERTLKIIDSSAKGAVFADVTFDRRDEGASVEFADVDLSGSVFIGCQLRSAHFTGLERERDEGIEPTTPARTLVMKSASWQPAVLDRVVFDSYDLGSFAFWDCLLQGDVTFRNCSLAGGSITASAGIIDDAHKVAGDLTFEAGCDLTALEFQSLDFADGVLSVSDSVAAGLYLQNCKLPQVDGGWRARFDRCPMPSALFADCTVHSLLMAGSKGDFSDSGMLIVRGSDPEHTLGHCRFEHVDMENFTFEKLTVDGPLEFLTCKLSGGTIKGVPEGEEGVAHSHLRVAAPILVSAGCELDALEFNSVAFDGGRLCIAESECRGMLLVNVEAIGADGAVVIDLEDCDLSGAVVIASKLAGVRMHASDASNRLIPAWGLTIRAGSDLGDVLVNGYDLDGLVLQDVRLTGPVIFKRSTLLRSRFASITGDPPDACIDLVDADLLFAQVSDDLRGAEPTEETMSARVLRMTAGQWSAAEKASTGLKHLRYS